MSQVIIAICPDHPARPDRSCARCLTAIHANRMNPLWREAGYEPVLSWAGPDTFLTAVSG